MKQPFSVLVARAQAREPHKPYRQICSELSRRRKKATGIVAPKNNEYWWNKD
jgi:hypothetical protein